MTRSNRHLFRQYVTAAFAAVLIAVAPAVATAKTRATGGVTLYTNTDTGGVPNGAPIPSTKPPKHKDPAKKKPARKKKKRRPRARPPLLIGFALGSKTLFDEGRPLTLKFRFRSRAPRVRVRAVVRTVRGRFVKTIDLGVFATGRLQSANAGQIELGVGAPGDYKIRLSATDGKGRKAARSAKVAAWQRFTFADHRFPLVGDFSWGGEDARFGADRPGHKHQGQDLVAAEGTPVVAPHGGKVTWVRYQADGAGHYVVVDSEGEDRDYVFMHLKAGSIEVKEGDVVPTGRILGRVGSTGASSGPHLHFEIWTGGPWALGGRPVDPRPLLESWYKGADGQARAQNVPHPVDGHE